MIGSGAKSHRKTLQKPMNLTSNFDIFQKMTQKVFINDSVYKDLAFAFVHFSELHFLHWKSDDPQRGGSPTRNSEKRNAF